MRTVLTNQPTTELLKKVRTHEHPLCMVCSPANPLGLGVEYRLEPDGGVTGTFCGGAVFQGFSGLLHGGAIAMLLDGAMTNCLFALGLKALTAELRVRYVHPVRADEPVTVQACRLRAHPPLHLLEAHLEQAGIVRARATAKFVEGG